jgi:hypothetical protein
MPTDGHGTIRTTLDLDDGRQSRTADVGGWSSDGEGLNRRQEPGSIFSGTSNTSLQEEICPKKSPPYRLRDFLTAIGFCLAGTVPKRTQGVDQTRRSFRHSIVRQKHGLLGIA